MARTKNIRTRGKLRLSSYFQYLEEGDSVAVVRERSIPANFPERMQGLAGVVVGKRGKSYIVDIKEHDKTKSYIIQPIHLKKLKTVA
jgi:large subunit ribosomal protein L21e